MGNYFAAVRLDEDLCKGCINCIKRCPTQAIRVRNGKAVITKEFCINCGECIRICPHHAKSAVYDPLEVIKNYEYTVALPAPSLYGQFNNLKNINILLTALKHMGFDDIFEVSAAAEYASGLSAKYIKNNPDKWPIISTACPSVVRLISVRFPNLLDHLLPIKAPVDIAASIARENAMKQTGLPSDKIGIIFISPCAAKVSAIKTPIGFDKSDVDAVVAIKDVYPKLLTYMAEIEETNAIEDLSISGMTGINWGGTGGEADGLHNESYLAADGIENVIKVLDDLEDRKISDIEFIELNACCGGCVGGVLTVENPFVAKVKLKQLGKYTVLSGPVLRSADFSDVYWSKSVNYEPVFKIGTDIKESIEMSAKIEELCNRFPGLDCGSCGAPTCKALAEDVVRGVASEKDCIHILREYIHRISDEISTLDTGSGINRKDWYYNDSTGTY